MAIASASRLGETISRDRSFPCAVVEMPPPVISRRLYHCHLFVSFENPFSDFLLYLYGILILCLTGVLVNCRHMRLSVSRRRVQWQCPDRFDWHNEYLYDTVSVMGMRIAYWLVVTRPVHPVTKYHNKKAKCVVWFSKLKFRLRSRRRDVLDIY